MAWLEVCLHIKAPAEAIQAWKLNMSYFSLYFYPNSSSYRGSYFKYGIGVRVRKFCGFILGGLSGVGCWVSSDVCNYGWDLHVVGGVLWGGYFGDMCFIHTPAAEFCKLMGIFSLYFRPWMAHKPTTRSSRRGVSSWPQDFLGSVGW